MKRDTAFKILFYAVLINAIVWSIISFFDNNYSVFIITWLCILTTITLMVLKVLSDIRRILNKNA